MMSDKEMMRNELNEDWIYRLKVVVMGSKGRNHILIRSGQKHNGLYLLS